MTSLRAQIEGLPRMTGSVGLTRYEAPMVSLSEVLALVDAAEREGAADPARLTIGGFRIHECDFMPPDTIWIPSEKVQAEIRAKLEATIEAWNKVHSRAARTEEER